MSLLYRGVWCDARPELNDSIANQFQAWVTDKAVALEVPDEGTAKCQSDLGTIEVTVRRAITGSANAIQIEFIEQMTATGDRWTTRLTGIETDGTSQWVWVDLDLVATGASQRRRWQPPSLVLDLIKQGIDVRVDQVRITPGPHPINASGLVGLIRNSERSLPLVVFSQDCAGFTPMMARANATARRLAGAVQVVTLTNDQVAPFNDAIGDELAVSDGDARVYLPNLGPRGLHPDRHRSISRQQMGDDAIRSARIVAIMVGAAITARRPPAVYELVKRQLRLGRNRSDAEFLAHAEQELARLTRERDELKDDVSRLEEELFDTQADLEESVVNSAKLRNELQLIQIYREPPQLVAATIDLAITPSSITEALQNARQRLERVVLPDGIEHDLDELDAHTNSRSWGALTWAALRALHLYAEAEFDGNFKQWCIENGHQWAWPSNDKKLSMRESESVEQNRRLREQRLLPVSIDIDPSGVTLMWAHQKIAEGGGPLAPRVYFYDDTRGVTRNVHIGFVGPHRYMENTKSN